MKSRISVAIGLATVLGTCATFGVLAQNGQHGKGRMEKHPELVMSLRHLNAAKTTLQKASRDFDGHREKAVDLTNQAIKEVELAIASDKK